MGGGLKMLFLFFFLKILLCLLLLVGFTFWDLLYHIGTSLAVVAVQSTERLLLAVRTAEPTVYQHASILQQANTAPFHGSESGNFVDDRGEAS